MLCVTSRGQLVDVRPDQLSVRRYRLMTVTAHTRYSGDEAALFSDSVATLPPASAPGDCDVCDDQPGALTNGGWPAPEASPGASGGIASPEPCRAAPLCSYGGRTPADQQRLYRAASGCPVHIFRASWNTYTQQSMSLFRARQESHLVLLQRSLASIPEHIRITPSSYVLVDKRHWHSTTCT